MQLFNDDEGAIYAVLQLGYHYQYYNSTVYRISATSGAIVRALSRPLNLGCILFFHL